jgi:Na+/H+-dicarboxylate symporter
MSLFKTLSNKMPLILFGLIASILAFGNLLPVGLKSGLYATSISIKGLIVTVLPVIIFGLLFSAAVLMAKKATWIVGLILGTVCLSTFVAVFLARFVGLGLYNMDLSMELPPVITPLTPLWEWELDAWVSNSVVMLSAVFFGLIGAFFIPERALMMSRFLDQLVGMILKTLTLVIPVFVVGFVIKLQHEGVFITILKNYSVVFACIAVAQFTYIFLLYWALAKGSVSRMFGLIQNMIPATISGFTSMSSAASMPLLIQGVEKNTTHKQMAKVTVPVLVNIHMIGECFTDVILAYAVLKTYGVADPSWPNYLMFSVWFFVARFACAGIPGGGILVIKSLLLTYFAFTDAMFSLIYALYVLFDPVLTAGNILGDGALAQWLDSIVTKRPHLIYSKQEIAQMQETRK